MVLKKCRITLVTIALSMIVLGCEKVDPEMTLDEYKNYVKTRYTPDAIDCGETSFNSSFITGNQSSHYGSPEVVSCIQTMHVNEMSAYMFIESVFGNTSYELYESYNTHEGRVARFSYSRTTGDPSALGRVSEIQCTNPTVTEYPDPISLQIFDCE